MKTRNFLMIAALVAVFFSSCSKEEWQTETLVDVAALTDKTFETFDWQMVSRDITHSFAEKIWLAKADGQLFESELKSIGDPFQNELIAALLITEKFTKQAFEEIEAQYELGDLFPQAEESMGVFVYRWTGATKTKRTWWGSKYTVYLCHKHQYGTIKCNGMRYDKKVYERTSYDCA